MRGGIVLVLLLSAIPAFAQTPSPEDQTRWIEQAREKALNYSKSLPDFLCTQVIRRFLDRSDRGVWTPLDSLTVQISYFQQREGYKLVSINGEKTDQTYDQMAGSLTRGEFGSVLRWTFEPASQARFKWEKWERVSGRRVAVFHYEVEVAHSTFGLTTGKETISVGYHGQVAIDPETYEVMRHSLFTDPQEYFPIRSTSMTLDYAYEKVNGQSYLLPIRGETIATPQLQPQRPISPRMGMRQPVPRRYRNVMEFHSYRKFSTESKLSFDSADPK